jgi:hypothetical protein
MVLSLLAVVFVSIGYRILCRISTIRTFGFFLSPPPEDFFCAGRYQICISADKSIVLETVVAWEGAAGDDGINISPLVNMGWKRRGSADYGNTVQTCHFSRQSCKACEYNTPQ